MFRLAAIAGQWRPRPSSPSMQPLTARHDATSLLPSAAAAKQQVRAGCITYTTARQAPPPPGPSPRLTT
jgi:hypothetical protein